MYERKEYKTLRVIATFTSAFGWGIVGLFAFFGLIMGIAVLGGGGIILGPLFGALIGLPYVATGQLIGVFMDQKEVLEQILNFLSTGASSETAKIGPPSGLGFSERTKKCPACAEQIKLEALVCRFCGQKFDEKDVQKEIEAIKAKHVLTPQDEERLKEKLNVGVCPKCDAFQNFDWGPQELRCKTCGAAFPRRLVS